MLISEMIAELQERLEIYGDATVCYRDAMQDMDIDIMCTYFDQDENKMVLSDFYSIF
jgi:hypothetical protein